MKGFIKVEGYNYENTPIRTELINIQYIVKVSTSIKNDKASYIVIYDPRGFQELRTFKTIDEIEKMIQEAMI
jgi:hypothetical protein